MEGGDLRWFWSGFDIFERTDIVSSLHHSFTFIDGVDVIKRSRCTAWRDTMKRPVSPPPLVSGSGPFHFLNLMITFSDIKPSGNVIKRDSSIIFPFVHLMFDCFQLAYLYTVHLSPKTIAPLFGFTGAVLTLSKTTFWVLQEHFCGRCSSKNVDPMEFLKFWIAPNVWALFALAL